MFIRVAACVALASLSFVSGCGDSRDSAQGESAAETDLVSATPRGLAAGLLAHLPHADVTYVGGADEDGAISVMVETDSPELGTVGLYVLTESDIGAIACGSDSGYTSISCDADDVSTTDVLARTNNNDKMPDIMGRFYDASRKNVLVQVWGSSDDDAESLVRELLKDPLLGAVTSHARNEAGEQLTEFEELQTESSLTMK